MQYITFLSIYHYISAIIIYGPLLKLKSCNFYVVIYGDIVLITTQSEYRKRKVSLPVSQSKPLLIFGRLYSLEKDLGLHGNQFQVAVSIFFVTYILSELPSNLVLKKLRPSRWISFITIAWSIIATLTGVTQNYAGLVVCRLFLGVVEGGLFPGTFNFTYEFVRDILMLSRLGDISDLVLHQARACTPYWISFLQCCPCWRMWRLACVRHWAHGWYTSLLSL